MEVMRIKEMITKGELRPVLKQFLPTSTVRNALRLIRIICVLILGSKGLTDKTAVNEKQLATKRLDQFKILCTAQQ